jgi:hypothetical protein
MRQVRPPRAVAVAAVALGLVLAVVGTGQAASVMINGQPLVTSRSPLTLGGSMLLPMRDVFEALNAEVKWFAQQQQIIAIRGATTIALTIGSRTATVNGASLQLPVAPMLVGGSTYVPLRFPAEAFGGTVKWDNATQTAFIEIPTAAGGTPPPTDTGPVVVPPTPPPPPAPQVETVEGTLVQLFPGATTSVIVQLSGSESLRMLQIGATTTLTRGPSGDDGQAAKAADLQVGDLLQGETDAKGMLTRLAASYGEKAGKVVALAGNTLVFEDGTALTLSSNVNVLGPGNAPAALTAVTAGVQAVARYQPLSKLVWRITLPAPPPVITPPSTKVEILAVGITNPGTVFKGGDVLTIRLQGTAGGQANAILSAKVANNLPLAEVTPGVYEAQFTVPTGLAVKAAKLTGNLTKGGKKAAVVVSPTTITVDSAPPTVTEVLPADGSSTENASPTIAVAYNDGNGSGVDLNSLQLQLDDTDVTATTTVGADRATCVTENLAAGAHRAQVTLKDLAGNEISGEWSFTVAAPAQAVIISVSHDAKGVLQKGQYLTLIARVAQPGGTATCDLGDWKHGVAMPRIGNSANYRLVYKVQPGVKVLDALVTVHYRTPGGVTASMEATNLLSMDATLPAELTVTAPADASQAGDQIQVQGTAPPDSSVRVSIGFKAKLIIPVAGQLWQGTVKADAQGKWETPAVSSDVFLGKANEYDILVELLDAAGAAIATKELKLTK